MSDSPSMDHWKDLADLIGAEVPDEPIEPEQQAEPEVSPEETSADDPVAEEPAQMPPMEEPCQEPEPEPESAAEPVTQAVESTEPPTPADENHWWGLASQLGIELPEPEPKPKPEPEPEPESAAEPMTQAVESTEPPAPADEFTFGESETAWGVDAVEMPATESQDPIEVDDASRVESPKDDFDMPLFEDPGLSLETPGVLDAIFEEAEAETAEADSEKPITPFETKDEEREVDEDAQQVLPATDTEPDKAAEAEDDSDEKPTKRRRRRRRRRPPRKDRDESGEAEEESGAEAKTPASEEAAVDSRQGPQEDRSEDTDKAEAAKLKHRKIPTWEEAIEIVITTNKEARSKSSGGSRGRRRGRK